jgi:leucine rich repeat domain protein
MKKLINQHCAHWLIGKFAHLLIFILANLLILVGCSKSKDEPTDPNSYCIVLTSQKAVGKTVELTIKADKTDKAGVWVDLNNNGSWDEGVDEKPTNFDNRIKYPLQAQTFRIYGKVNSLNCRDNELTAIDISGNPALTELYAAGNLLPSIGHLEPIKKLWIDSHTLLASNLPKELTYLRISETSPLSTIDTKPFTHLNVLDIDKCKSITNLYLNHNTKLEKLYVSYTGLSTLELLHQPNLEVLVTTGTSLSKINIEGNKALNFAGISLSEDGKGIQGEALMDFLKQLPTREKNKEGKIYLSPAQEAEEGCKKLLEDKFWIIGH